MRAVDEVYDLFMSGRAAGSGETEEGGTERMPELDECLFRMGLLQVEDKDDVTTSVWSEKAEGAIMAPDGSLKVRRNTNGYVLVMSSDQFIGGQCKSAHSKAHVRDRERCGVFEDLPDDVSVVHQAGSFARKIDGTI